MINSAELLSITKNNKGVVEPNKIELFPRKRRAIKLRPDFHIDYYYFKVVTEYKLDEAKIIINGFEIFNLSYINTDNNTYTYESNKISAKNFLGFNLGLFEVNLLINSELYNLSTIVNKLGEIKEIQIQYMYELIASSDFFNLYIYKFNRANTLANEVYSSENSHFWLRVSIAKELLNETARFLTGELAFTSRVSNKHDIKKYHPKLQIDKEDINWLLSHPNELTPSPCGDVSYSGFNYEIENIKHTKIIEDYNTYENKLLLSCLYSVKTQLLKLCDDYSETKLFPHNSIRKIIIETDRFISFIQTKLGLKPPFNTTPEYSNKYLDDYRYVNLFGIISRWYSINDLEYGNTIRSPIPGLTTIFEYYCFLVFVNCFKTLGFTVDESHFKNKETVGEVQLIRNNERVNITYEPYITKSTKSPLVTSRSSPGCYKPDIVLSYFNGEDTFYGVVDAKFSGESSIVNKLGPEIYYKYGLFLHAPNLEPIDFVYAMHPSAEELSTTHSARSQEHEGKIKPSLGFFSVPFNDNAVNEIIDILENTLFKKSCTPLKSLRGQSPSSIKQ